MDIMLYLIRRGRENLRQMTKHSFAVNTEASGQKYIFQVNSELDKNHSTNDSGNDTTGEGRIYELQGNPKCPVKNFEDYMRYLHPTEDTLWQRPLDSFDPELQLWYYPAPLGE